MRRTSRVSSRMMGVSSRGRGLRRRRDRGRSEEERRACLIGLTGKTLSLRRDGTRDRSTRRGCRSLLSMLYVLSFFPLPFEADAD